MNARNELLRLLLKIEACLNKNKNIGFEHTEQFQTSYEITTQIDILLLELNLEEPPATIRQLHSQFEHKINPIPPWPGDVTPQSSWKQPNRANIKITDTFAIMTQADFDLLKQYDLTKPTGVYNGKMWKAHVNRCWVLRWYGYGEHPNTCSNHQREIVIKP